MAKRARAFADNVDGAFFVDDSCIDCGTCRWVAPASFADAGSHSYVAHQPATPGERDRAAKAIVACPVAAIGTRERLDPPPDPEAFPDLVEDDVFHCGYHARSSYGAASYLIVRPEGNVLVDSPRFAAPLVRRLEALGGIATMFLTHRDDVADHQKFRDHFGCARILHAADLGWNIRKVERTIDGVDPVRLADDLLAIPVPGHTEGSMCLLYRDKFLFAGDHCSWERATGTLRVSRHVCWYDWEEQVRSTARLAGYRFEWLLPGHGAPVRHDAPAMHAAFRDWLGRHEAERKAPNMPSLTSI